MGITYREAKRILAKQDEARDVINSYRGMETLGKRLQLRSNKELILKLFEIEEDSSIVEVFTLLSSLRRAMGAMQRSCLTEVPGELKEDTKRRNPILKHPANPKRRWIQPSQLTQVIKNFKQT